MYFEINVALNGRHFFATAERSITDIDTCHKVYNLFKKKFPEIEGYSIEVTKIETIGHTIEFREG